MKNRIANRLKNWLIDTYIRQNGFSFECRVINDCITDVNSIF